MPNEKDTQAAWWLVRYYYFTGILEGVAALALLLSIPTESESVWLFGISKLRMGLVLIFLLVIGMFAWLALKAWFDQSWQLDCTPQIEKTVEEYRWSIPLIRLLAGLAILLPYMHLRSVVPLEGLPLRISPFVFFILTRTIQALLVFLLLSRIFRSQSRENSGEVTNLTLNPKKIIVLLAGLATVLVLASIMGDILEYSAPNDRAAVRFNKKFNVDLEMTIPTYFNALILLFSGVLLTLVAMLKKKTRDPYTINWSILAILFWFMAMDETISLHEFLIKPLRDAFNTSGFLYFAWVIVAIPLLVLMGITFRKFILALPKRIRTLILVAGSIYVASALGIEMVGGWYFEQFGGSQIPYIILTTVEETLEMAGILIFIYALLEYLCEFFPEIQLSIRDRQASLHSGRAT
jgi:hypothetical protein